MASMIFKMLSFSSMGHLQICEGTINPEQYIQRWTVLLTMLFWGVPEPIQWFPPQNHNLRFIFYFGPRLMQDYILFILKKCLKTMWIGQTETWELNYQLASKHTFTSSFGPLIVCKLGTQLHKSISVTSERTKHNMTPGTKFLFSCLYLLSP